MYSIRVKFGLIASFLLFPHSLQAAQENQPASETPGQSSTANNRAVIKGRVTDATTGKGLSKSTVTTYMVCRESSSPNSWTVETDGQGNYEIGGLPPCKFLVSASRVGFVDQSYNQTGKRKTASWRTPVTLVLHSEEVLSEIDFKLIPTGVVEGRIFGPDGEPAGKARVQLVHFQMINGKKSMLTDGEWTTDDRGNYRIFDVAPGHYYLLVHPYRLRVDDRDRSVWPPTFFPGVLDSSQATQVEVVAGAEVSGIDFDLIEASAFSIKGKLISLTGGSAPQTSVSATPMDADVIPPSGSEYPDSQGNFIIRGLLPGKYRLTASISDFDQELYADSIVEVVDRDVEGVSLTLERGGEIKGKIIFDGTVDSGELGTMQVQFLAELPFSGIHFKETQVRRDLTFDCANMRPDTYRLAVTVPKEGFYVKSIRIEGRDYIDQPFEVRNNVLIQRVDVELTAHGARLGGTVRKEKTAETVGGAIVVLFSTDPEKWSVTSRLTRFATTHQEGSYSIRDIIPGNYSLCAVADYDPEIIYNRAFFEKLQKISKPVRLVADKSLDENLVATEISERED